MYVPRSAQAANSDEGGGQSEFTKPHPPIEIANAIAKARCIIPSPIFGPLIT